MDHDVFIKKLCSAFEENGMGALLKESSSERLYKLACLLVQTNKMFNLTAITDDNGIILKHFVDSATISRYIPVNSSLIDVGCGAGFPSLPISILREDVRVVSVDSTKKKIDFIDHASKLLEITNVYPKCARAEDFAKEARESFDIATSRAVARLNILDELCIPFVKLGGMFIAMKSSKGDEEYKEAKKGIEILGAEFSSKESAALSFAEEKIEREIFVFKKTKNTSPAYPRNYSQITKKPL